MAFKKKRVIFYGAYTTLPRVNNGTSFQKESFGSVVVPVIWHFSFVFNIPFVFYEYECSAVLLQMWNWKFWKLVLYSERGKATLKQNGKQHGINLFFLFVISFLFSLCLKLSLLLSTFVVVEFSLFLSILTFGTTVQIKRKFYIDVSLKYADISSLYLFSFWYFNTIRALQGLIVLHILPTRTAGIYSF